MRIEIDEELAQQLLNDIERLLYHWHPSRNDTDHVCEFCGSRSPTSEGDIRHREDCNGTKYRELLERALYQDKG